ncbi:MAG TPA: hypothetical protein VL738_09965 [Dactylosporangium sp.]|jgi:hypothetical protein|nr:hypothetical protein [Dactylosporangium sp.]
MNARTVHMALRGSSAALAVLAAVQVLLAGSFLSGHYPVLQWHMITGFTMVVLGLVQLVLVFLPGRRERGASVLRHGIAMPFALALQGVLGVFRILELHVPIGVLMVVGLTQMANELWRTPLPARKAKAGAPAEQVGAAA